jgi:Domain of unknown function (DUF4338)
MGVPSMSGALSPLGHTDADDTQASDDVLDREGLRIRVEQHLQAQGFVIRNGRLLAPVMADKDKLRRLHMEAVTEQRSRAMQSLQKYEKDFTARLASGESMDPAIVSPALVQVTNRRSFEAQLWRWSSLHWSIPVSHGYGRRLRFLVVDRSNENKLIGLIGLADPVFALGCRDAWIGWSRERRKTHLTSIMDAFVLGAVPPYRDVLGGKLVALLATSAEVRRAFDEKYGHRKTLIAGRDPDAQLALVTTSSALGRSSVYNRLVGPDKQLAFNPVGYTSGSGDFHLSGAIYRDLARFAAQMNSGGVTYRHERWTGSGFRNRREVIQRSLDALGLDSYQLRAHGIRRQVFIAPLMANAAGYLAGSQSEPEWRTRSVDDLSAWWRGRWGVRRAATDKGWRSFDPVSWLLWPDEVAS